MNQTSNRQGQDQYSFVYQQDIDKFRNGLQRGDLSILTLLNYVYVLVGQTKTGKTTTSHLLAGGVLKCKKYKGDDKLFNELSRNKHCKIGHEHTSQTQIPNIFQAKYKADKYGNQMMYIADSPGYGDTKGVLKLLSNAYYHYRLYSKSANMKFIISVDYSHIGAPPTYFLDTIRQFTSSFKNYEQMKLKLWQSCCFLITKVPNEPDYQKNIESKLLSIAEMVNTKTSSQEQKSIHDLIHYIIKNQKIFHTFRYTNGQTADATGLLQKIDEKVSTWWSRKVDPVKQIVDMTPIALNVGKQIQIECIKYKKSEDQFKQLIAFYKRKIDEVLAEKYKGSLPDVLKQLVKDAMNKLNSSNFLNVMKNNISAYSAYQKSQGNDSDIRKIRKKNQIKLFDIATQSASESQNKKKNKKKDACKYKLKLFQALKQIEQLKNESPLKTGAESIEWYEQCQVYLYDILKLFSKISYKKINRQDIIFKYNYVIYRLLVEAKMFFLLIEMSSPLEIREALKKIAGQSLHICRPLADFMQGSYELNGQSYKYKQLKDSYINQMQLSEQQLQNMIITKEYIDFFNPQKQEKFQDCNSDDENEEKMVNANQTKNLTPQQESKVLYKIVKLQIKYSNQIIEQNQDRNVVNQSQINQIVKTLIQSRIKCQDMNDLVQDPSIKQNLSMSIVEITQNIAQLLTLCKKYPEARLFYSNIKHVSAVCQLYQKEIQGLDKLKKLKHQQKPSISTRIQYSKFLAQHLLQERAIKVLQDAYQKAKNPKELAKISKQLSDLRLQLKNRDRITTYQQSLFDSEYFTNFSQQQKSRILKI